MAIAVTHARSLRLTLALPLALALVPIALQGQDSPARASTIGLAPGELLIGAWLGGAWSSSYQVSVPNPPQFDFGLAAVRLSIVMVAVDRFALAWTVDAIPLALLGSVPDRRPLGSLVAPSTGTVAAIGVSPLGLELYAAPVRHLRLVVHSSAGILDFARAVPLPEGRGFNFTYQFGGGVQWVIGNGMAFTAGYRWHHLSNGRSALSNPGVNSNILYLGWSRPLK